MKRLLLIVSVLLLTFTNSKALGPRGLSIGDQTQLLRFYPNPAINNITFDFTKDYEKGYALHIFNMLGRKMRELPNLAEHTIIDLSDFTRGVYIYQLVDRTGNIVESGKFQVSK